MRDHGRSFMPGTPTARAVNGSNTPPGKRMWSCSSARAAGATLDTYSFCLGVSISDALFLLNMNFSLCSKVGVEHPVCQRFDFFSRYVLHVHSVCPEHIGKALPPRNAFRTWIDKFNDGLSRVWYALLFNSQDQSILQNRGPFTSCFLPSLNKVKKLLPWKRIGPEGLQYPHDPAGLHGGQHGKIRIIWSDFRTIRVCCDLGKQSFCAPITNKGVEAIYSLEAAGKHKGLGETNLFCLVWARAFFVRLPCKHRYRPLSKYESGSPSSKALEP